MLVGLGFAPDRLAGTEQGSEKLAEFRFFRFQPAEPVKLLLIIFVAAYLAENSPFLSEEDEVGRFLAGSGQVWPVLLWCMTLLLLVVQKDLGATLILVFSPGLCGHRASCSLIFGGMIFVWLPWRPTVISSHQARVAIWINPWPYADAAGYQLIQSLLLAQGLVWSRNWHEQTFYLPAAATDFVFRGLCELGFGRALF